MHKRRLQRTTRSSIIFIHLLQMPNISGRTQPPSITMTYSNWMSLSFLLVMPCLKWPCFWSHTPAPKMRMVERHTSVNMTKVIETPSTLLAIGLINLNKALDSTPVFLITALDDYSEHLPLRAPHFHTPRCRKLKFWFHIQFLILFINDIIF